MKKSKSEKSKQEKSASEADSLLKEALKPSEYKPSQLLAWSSTETNKITIDDFEKKQNYANFDGAQLKKKGFEWTHLKEIPNTSLLVSLHHSCDQSANMEIFEISQKGHMQKVYAFEEVLGVTGWGDVTHNSRRRILGAISIGGKMAYRLYSIDANAFKATDVSKLYRKSKWQPHYSTVENNYVAGLDFDPSGAIVATLDQTGVCLVSDVNTNNYYFHLSIGSRGDTIGRCRWSPNIGEPILFVKYEQKQLNILDVEKKTLTLKAPFQLEQKGRIKWIDVCPSDGNLIASGAGDIKIYDRRESKIIKTFEKVHSSKI